MKRRILRKKECKCSICRLFNSDAPKHYLNGSRTKCDFCERINLEMAAYIPLEVQEFFGWQKICWCCRNHINSYVTDKFRLCWGNSSYDALCLAFLTMLFRELARLAFQPTYLKMRDRGTLHRGRNYVKK